MWDGKWRSGSREGQDMLEKEKEKTVKRNEYAPNQSNQLVFQKLKDSRVMPLFSNKPTCYIFVCFSTNATEWYICNNENIWHPRD